MIRLNSYHFCSSCCAEEDSQILISVTPCECDTPPVVGSSVGTAQEMVAHAAGVVADR